MKLKDKTIIPDFGDMIKVDEFKDNVDCGGFIDYDGYGYYVSDGYAWKKPKVYPSEIIDNNNFINECKEQGITHVCWFNK